MPIAKCVVSDIEWDADDDNESIEELGLPVKMNVDICPDNEHTLTERVSDAITNITGFCHNGFCFSVEEWED